MAANDPGTMLGAALGYARMGWRVFPVHSIEEDGRCTCGHPRRCDSPGKHPRTRNGLKDATTDESQIRDWWRQWPTANVAIATGKDSGVWALDVDGEVGEESLFALRDHRDLPQTLQQVTGSRVGRHFFFAHPGRYVRTAVGAFGDEFPKLDLRGDGGYVLAPPSNHVSGGVYFWDGDEPFDGIAPLPAPEWLLDLVSAPARRKPPNEGGVRLHEETTPIPDGERNKTLFRIASSLRGMGLAYDAILAQLRVVNAARCVPPKEDSVLQTIAGSAAKYEANSIPRNLRDEPPIDIPPWEDAPPSSSPETEDDEHSGDTGEPEETDEGDYFRRTDLGNARRLEHSYGTSLRYCADWGRWLIWDGVVWAEDAPGNPGARTYAHRLAEALTRNKKTKTWGITSQSSGKISAMLTEAQALPRFTVRYSQLDTHEFLLPCANGVVDLRTGRLVDPDPELLLTKRLAVPFDPEAACPAFERFLMDIMRERKELVDLLLRAMGYSLTGSIREHKFFLLYGERGRNGKSTLMDTLQLLLGDGLCYTLPKKLLTDADSDAARFARAQIEGKRVVYANETKRSSRFDTEFVKEFVGQRHMSAERKGKDGYQFEIHAKLWYGVNALPEADFDPAFSARVVPIPFEQSFYPESSKEYREGDLPPDTELPEKLGKELPGILALLVKGCLRWQEMGGLGTPEEVRALKDRYERENDSLADWTADRCLEDPKARIRQADAWTDYADWCKRTRPANPLKKRKDFKRELLKRPGIGERDLGGVDFYAGIEIKPASTFDGDEE